MNFTQILGGTAGGLRGFITNITGPNCCVSAPDPNVLPIDPNWGVAPYRNLVHYQQMIRACKFQAWDAFSSNANRQLYGTNSPPQYYPQKVPAAVPIFVVSGASDWMADRRNVARLVSNLPTPPKQLVVPGYAHLDLLFSSRVVADVFTPVTSFIESIAAA